MKCKEKLKEKINENKAEEKIGVNELLRFLSSNLICISLSVHIPQFHFIPRKNRKYKYDIVL